jgi:hypothetical protein
MKKIQLFEAFVNEGKIRDDAYALAKELVDKGIALDTYVTPTGNGYLGLFKINLASDGKSYKDLKTKIEKQYKRTQQTSNFSSQYYYSPETKLYFYFYGVDRPNRSYKPKLDKMVDYDYSVLVKRRLPDNK